MIKTKNILVNLVFVIILFFSICSLYIGIHTNIQNNVDYLNVQLINCDKCSSEYNEEISFSKNEIEESNISSYIVRRKYRRNISVDFVVLFVAYVIFNNMLNASYMLYNKNNIISKDGLTIYLRYKINAKINSKRCKGFLYSFS